MSKIKLLCAALAIGIAVAPSAGAHQTTATCQGAVRGGEQVIAIAPVEGRELLYLDRVQVGPPYILGFWLYMESNGHPGLQTQAGSESALVEGFFENCTIAHTGVSRPDTFLF